MSDINQRLKIKTIAEEIQKSNNVMILTHERPDGDAIGSVLALLIYFLNNNKNAVAYFPEAIPERYNQFLTLPNVFIQNLPNCSHIEKFICLDCSDFKRLALDKEVKSKLGADKLINIDHHFDNDLYGYINYIDSNACSTGEALYDIFEEIPDFKITPAAADNLLLAMIMDTGGFRFDNTTAKVLLKVSALIDLGGNYHAIIKSMFFKKSYNFCKLESDIILNHLSWDYENKFVYTYLSPELLDEYKVDISETEGLIDSFRTFDGVVLAALITERNGGFKISLRSNDPEYAVVDIAHKLNGGGHKLAAGCFIETKCFYDAEKRLTELIGNLFE